MPRYSWLLTQKLDTNAIPPRIKALRKAGVPYPAGLEQTAIADASKQALTIVTNLAQGQVKATADKEIIALIAYLQRLGTDIKSATNAPAAPPIQAAPVKAAQINDNNATARN